MVHWTPQLHQQLIKALDQKQQMNSLVKRTDLKRGFHLFTLDHNFE